MRSAYLLVFVLACSKATPADHAAPAVVSHPSDEADLPSVVLSPGVASRLRLETSVVRAATAPRVRLVGGEVIVPPGRTLLVTAPIAGEVRLLAGTTLAPGSPVRRGTNLLRLAALAPADRDTRARVGREVAAAEANVTVLEARVERNRLLVERQSGSARALEEATAARDVALADLEAARSRSATLSRAPLLSDVAMVVRAPSDGVIRVASVAERQVVAVGSPLFELVAVDALQIRVPVYSGDLGRLAPDASLRVRRSGEERAFEARFVPGPPTAEPDRNTVDRYVSFTPDAGFVPGERVLVELPLEEESSVTTVPASSVVVDAWGGTWVYVCDGSRFTRVRVDPVRRAADAIVLARGPAVGTCVVSVGAVELFGTEFPPGH